MSDAHRLVNWFRANARALPWRTQVRDPYRTLVAEIMAQQTQLDRVVPHFKDFVCRFPDLAALAAASEDEVVAAWSGLGYYRRARLLHRLAREVAAVGGDLPESAAELQRLPGIGPYTAAAVASLVHGEAAPLLDGNVARVGVRVLGLDGDPRNGPVRRSLLEWVRRLMDTESPAEINEGLMELGALVCTPTAPRCADCPLEENCRASAGGEPERFPRPRKQRSAIELRWLTAIAEDDAGRWLLRRVSNGPILKGLWLPPFAEIDSSSSLNRQVRGLLPVPDVGEIEFAAPVRHSITHRRIEVEVAWVSASGTHELPEGWRWADPRAPGVPTSSLLGKLLRSVENRTSAPDRDGSCG